MSEWLIALVVYSIIGVVVYLNRKKFTVMGKIVLAYKTKKPIAWMDKLSKAKRFWKVYATISIPFGFYYMAIVFYGLLENAVKILFSPAPTAGVAPLIPGVQLPGSPIYVPLFYGLIAIGVLAFVHEFAHGIIMRVEKIRIKSSGFGLALIFPFFFVEPYEREMRSSSPLSRMRVASAGASTNILLFFILLMFVLPMFFDPFVQQNSRLFIKIVGVNPDYPADLAGVLTGEEVVSINNVGLTNLTSLSELMDDYSPGDIILLTTVNNSYSLSLTNDPNNSSKGYMGLSLQQSSEFTDYAEQKYGSWLDVFMVVYELLFWIGMLNFLVGLINLLPMWFLDGGTMLYDLLSYVVPKKYLNKVSALVFNISLVLLIINILPFFSNLFISILS